MDIRPDYANVERDGRLEKVDPDEVAVGSVIVVAAGRKGAHRRRRAGRRIDAQHRSADRRKPAARGRPGDEIVSGCINVNGVLRVRTTKEFGESTASKILDLVENASSRKSKSEDFISRFARVYTPAVCAAALALAVLPPLVNLLSGRRGGLGDVDLPRADVSSSFPAPARW